MASTQLGRPLNLFAPYLSSALLCAKAGSAGNPWPLALQLIDTQLNKHDRCGTCATCSSYSYNRNNSATHTLTHTRVKLAWRPVKTATQIFNADSTAYAIVTGAQWNAEREKASWRLNKKSTLTRSPTLSLSASTWLPNS